MPKVICDLCIQQVKYSFKFRRQCKLSQQTLLFLLDDVETKSNTIDNITGTFWDNKNETLKQENEFSDNSYNDYMFLEESKVEIELSPNSPDDTKLGNYIKSFTVSNSRFHHASTRLLITQRL